MLDYPESMFSFGSHPALLMVIHLVFRSQALASIGFAMYSPPDAGVFIVCLPFLAAVSFVSID
jgi:hypothetical protein